MPRAGSSWVASLAAVSPRVAPPGFASPGFAPPGFAPSGFASPRVALHGFAPSGFASPRVALHEPASSGERRDYNARPVMSVSSFALARPLRLLSAVVVVSSALACSGESPTGGLHDDLELPGTEVASDESFEEVRNRAFRLVDSDAPAAQTLSALREAHALDPTAYGVNARLGALCVEQKLYAEALKHHGLALEARPEEATSRREVVWLSIQLGDPERALTEVEPLLADADRGLDALYLKALALDHLGRREDARAILQELPETGATSARVLRGRFAVDAGELDAARRDLEAALADEPDNQAALRALADACRRGGDLDQAARWDEVLTLLVALRDNRYTKPAETRADRKAQRQAGRSSDYIARELAAHEDRLRRLVELHPGWPEGFELLADLLARDDRADEACAVIEGLLSRHAARLDALHVLELRRRFCEGAEG
jgi:tetratricopeptide (TPR) repeat protein